jgi:hypothetical protein
MQMPVIAAPFNVAPNSNTCTSNLAIGASCKLTLIYTPGSTSGQGSYVVNYNNGTSAVNTTATIPYVGTNPTTYAILTTSPTSFSLSESHPLQRITVTNTGTASATGIALPKLTAPLTESATTCTSTLATSSSCSYDVYINYSQSPVTAGRESVTFSYNNGQQQSQTTNVAADWAQYVPPPLSVVAGCGYLLPATDTDSSCTAITVSIPTAEGSDKVINFSIPQESMAQDMYYFSNNYGADMNRTTSCIISAGNTSCDSTLLLCAGSNTNVMPVTVSTTATGYLESTTAVTGSNPKYIFVTNQTYPGDLKTAGGGTDGYDGANKLCQAAANAGSVTNIGGVWKALLETNNATKKCQFYKTTNNQLLGKATGGDFVGEIPIPTGVAIDKGPDNTTVGGQYVYTGSHGLNCNAWTSNSSSLQVGIGASYFVAGSWWYNGSIGCEYKEYSQLYCAQQ